MRQVEGGGGGTSASPSSSSEAVLWFFNKNYPQAASLLEVVAPSPSKSVLWGMQRVCQMFLKSSSVINLAQVGNVEAEASSWKMDLINNQPTISPGWDCLPSPDRPGASPACERVPICPVRRPPHPPLLSTPCPRSAEFFLSTARRNLSGGEIPGSVVLEMSCCRQGWQAAALRLRQPPHRQPLPLLTPRRCASSVDGWSRLTKPRPELHQTRDEFITPVRTECISILAALRPVLQREGEVWVCPRSDDLGPAWWVCPPRG